ncbi:MAG: hypothetical protein S4CHLAM123_09690 [Chlamydiales bacterium]|nr:hypothetical protein [Chlamydiales bacterium]
MLKAKDLRDTKDEELVLQLETLRAEIFELRSQGLENKAQKTHLIGQKRKEISRILTIRNEKRKGA